MTTPTGFGNEGGAFGGAGYTANQPKAKANGNNGGKGSSGGGGKGTGPASPPPGTPAVGVGTSAQDSALADLRAILATYGLQSLTNWAWGQITAGESEDQVVFNLSQTPQFNARFPAIKLRQQAGLPALSPGDYVTYEANAAQAFRAAGFPESYIENPANYTQLLATDVGPQELQNRINLAQQAAFSSPPDVQAILQRDYGIGPGLQAAAWFDPTVAEPLLAQHYLAAQIGGAADQAGYGSSKVTNDYLAQLGVSAQQAQSGFNDLASKQQLFTALPGESGSGIDEGTQVAAEFGQNAAAQQAISQVEQSRVGAFRQGGSFQSGSGGFTGLGTSRTQ